MKNNFVCIRSFNTIVVLFFLLINQAVAQPLLVDRAPDDCSAIAFNHIRDVSTTPIFALEGTASTTTDLEVELNTAADFSGTAYTEVITGTFDGDYTLSTTTALGLPTTNDEVYFVRVRESKDNGATWSPWSTQTWVYTYTDEEQGYHFTTQPQFDMGTLVSENYGNFITTNGTWLPTDYIGLDEGTYSFNAGNADGVYENGTWYPNVNYMTIGWQNNCNGNAKIWNGFPYQVFIPQGAQLGASDFSVVSTTTCFCHSQSVGMRLDVTALAEDNAPAMNGTNVRATTGLTSIQKLHYTDSWLNNTRYTLTSVTDILQEIIDRPGWDSGNNFNLLVRWDDDFSPGANNNRCIRQANFGAGTAPRIEGTFTRFNNRILFENINKAAFGPCAEWESLITEENTATCGDCEVLYNVYEAGTSNLVASGLGTIDLTGVAVDELDLEIQLRRDTDTPEVLSFIFTTTNDEEPPVITGTLEVLDEEGCGATDVSAATTATELEAMGVTISDNCTANEDLVITHNDVENGSCPVVVTRTYTVTDLCGNGSDIEQTISVNDTEAPTADTPVAINVDCVDDVPASDITVVTGILDNCDTNPTVEFIEDVSDGNVCALEEITRTYRITDECGNTSDVNQLITIDAVSPAFDLQGNNPSQCGESDGSIVVSGLLPSTDYELSYAGNPTEVITTDADGNYEISGLPAGTYDDFTIALVSCDVCEEEDAAGVTLLDPDAPNFSVEIISNPSTCGGEDGAILINGEGALLPLTDYELTYSVDGTVVGPTIITTDADGNYELTSLLDGLYTDFTLDFDFGGCETTFSDELQLSDPETPIADATTSTPELCENGTISLEATEVPGASYSWTGPDNFTSTDQNPVISDAQVVNSGSYTLVVTANECESDPVDIDVVVHALPVLEITDPSTSCAPETVDITLSLVTDGSTNASDLTYWEDEDATIPLTDPTSITVSGTYYIQADNNGCTVIAPVEVEIIEGVTYLVEGVNLSACGVEDGQFIITDLQPGEEYIIIYNEGPITHDPIEVTADASGTVEVTDLPSGDYEVVVGLAESGCSGDVWEVSLSEPPAPVITPIEDVEVCDVFELPTIAGTDLSGDQSFYSASGGAQGGGDEFTPGTEIDETMTLYAYDQSGECISEVSFTITITATPAPIETTEEYLLCFGDVEQGVEVTPEEGSLEWYSDSLLNDFYQSGNVLVPEDEIGEYVFYAVTVENDCASEVVAVTVNVTACELDFPTAFTPNGDGINDVWELPNLDLLYPNNKVKIFNRWGALLWEHDSAQQGPYMDNPWDGIHKGELLPLGSYLFIIEFNDGNDGKINGAVSILLD